MTEKNAAAFASDSTTGLTKREEFAKAAMQGLCANEGYWKFIAHGNPEYTAKKACEMADALITALNQPTSAGL